MSKQQKRHAYGWQRDLPDQRDYIYRRRMPSFSTSPTVSWWQRLLDWLQHKQPPPPVPYPEPVIPTSIDLRSQCPPIVDQGQLGSCTANALAGALGFLESKDGLTVKPFSRLFIYYNERVSEGSVGSDSGAEIRDGIKSLSQGYQGSCYEATWPYDISKFVVQPPSAAFQEGLTHQILRYETFATQQLADMRDCLASGYPFVFGFTVYESFESDTVASTGVVPMPASDDDTLGGHAVLAVGYDDATERFICRNSWGTGWGQKGYFTIPYAYLTDPDLASDFWTVTTGEDMLKRPQTG